MSKQKQVEYKGQTYQSTLEGRIAVFLDKAGIPFDYEIDTYEINELVSFKPDFKIKNAYIGNDPNRRYVWLEGKQVLWGILDEFKITCFSKFNEIVGKSDRRLAHSILVVNGIPQGKTPEDIMQDLSFRSVIPMDIVSEIDDETLIGTSPFIFPFNGNTVAGEFKPMTVCAKTGGGLYLGSIMDSCVDVDKTIFAYQEARNARLPAITDNIVDGDYEFTIADVNFDPSEKTKDNVPGMMLISRVSTGSITAKIITRMHLSKESYEWKFKDLCASLGIPYSSAIIDKDSPFWNEIIGRRGRAWFTHYIDEDGAHSQIDTFWHADGSRPFRKNGAKEWDRRNG